MRRAFSILLFPVLLLSISHHLAAQGTSSKSQPPANLRTPKEPVRSASVVLPPSQERQAEARKLYEEGLKLTGEGQYPQAAESLQQAVRLNPEYAEAYSALGRTYFKMRLWQQSVDNLRRASELNTKLRQAQEAQSQEPQVKKPQASNTPGNARLNDSQVSPLQVNNINAAPNAPRPESRPTPPASTSTAETKPKTPKANAGTSALRSNPPVESTPPKTVNSQPQSQTTNSTSGMNSVRPESKPTPQPSPQQVAPKDAALAPKGNTARQQADQQVQTRPNQTSTTTQSVALRSNQTIEPAPPKTVSSQTQSPTTNSTPGMNSVRPESKPTPQPSPQQVAPKDAALVPTGNAASNQQPGGQPLRTGTNQTSTTTQSSALRPNPSIEPAPPKTVSSQPQSQTTNSSPKPNFVRPESKPTPQPPQQQVAPKDAALVPTGNAASNQQPGGQPLQTGTNQTSTTTQSSALRSNQTIEPAPPKTVSSQTQSPTTNSTPGLNSVQPASKPTPQPPQQQVTPKDAALAPTGNVAPSQQPDQQLQARTNQTSTPDQSSPLRPNPSIEPVPPKTVGSQPQPPTANSTPGPNSVRPESKPTPQPTQQQVTPKDAALVPTGKGASSQQSDQQPQALTNQTSSPAQSNAPRANQSIEPAPPKTVGSQPQPPTANSTPGPNSVRPESKPTPQPTQQQVTPKDAALVPTGNGASSQQPDQQPQAPTNQTSSTTQSSAPQKFGKASVVSLTNEVANGLSQEPDGERMAMKVTPSAEPLPANSVTPTPAKSSTDDNSLTKLYRIGPNDVLDVRVNDPQSPKSTLFTITPSGLLEHPLLVEPLMVTGLTVEEIGRRIEDDLKTRALIENPKVIVGVRDYGSHSIIVSGLVKDSGTKFLMREAIPLYVVVADAQPLPEAARVTVVRNERNQIFEIDLSRAADMNLLVRPGDVVTFQPNVTQFVYIGGEVKIPGEKTFRRGLTLTQVILASGGVTSKSTLAQIARDDGRGFLVETSFKLREIVSGKTVDPLLKPGDRISILP